jgi:hypothetical protein
LPVPVVLLVVVLLLVLLLSVNLDDRDDTLEG